MLWTIGSCERMCCFTISETDVYNVSRQGEAPTDWHLSRRNRRAPAARETGFSGTLLGGAIEIKKRKHHQVFLGQRRSECEGEGVGEGDPFFS